MKPARVLIVDDASVMRKIVGRSLLARGEHHEVTFVFEGKLLSVSLDLHS